VDKVDLDKEKILLGGKAVKAWGKIEKQEDEVGSFFLILIFHLKIL
jgi:hypothetical protein